MIDETIDSTIIVLELCNAFYQSLFLVFQRDISLVKELDLVLSNRNRFQGEVHRSKRNRKDV